MADGLLPQNGGRSLRGSGWALLSKGSADGYTIYVSVSDLVISNYTPLEANLLVTVTLGLLLGMLAMLVFWMNLYSRAAEPAAGGSADTGSAAVFPGKLDTAEISLQSNGALAAETGLHRGHAGSADSAGASHGEAQGGAHTGK